MSNLHPYTKSSVQFPVECVPTSSRPTDCRLILSSVREGGAAATTLVFGLHPEVQSQKSIKHVSFTTRCYEMLQSQLEVSNPFPADCEFSITLKQGKELATMVAAEEADAAAAEPGAPRGRSGGGVGGKADKNKKSKKSKQPTIDPAMYPDPFGVDRRTVR